MQFSTVGCPVKTPDHERLGNHFPERCNLQLDDRLAGKQGPRSFGRKPFCLDNIRQLPRRKLCEVRANLASTRWMIASAQLNDQEFWLNARKRCAACQRRDPLGVCRINLQILDWLRVHYGDSPCTVSSEGQQQCEPVFPIHAQSSSLSISQPSLGDEVVEEWVQPCFAVVRLLLQGQGVGDCRMLSCEEARIIGECKSAARLLLKDASVSIAVMNPAPKCVCHDKYTLLF